MILPFLGAIAVAAAAATTLPAATPLPIAILQQPYGTQLRVAGTPACHANRPVFRILQGKLPPGLNLAPSGLLDGRAARPGLYRFSTLEQTGCSSTSHDWTLIVRAAPLIVVEPRDLEIAAGETATVLVASSWPDLAYTAGSPADWLSLRPERGRTPSAGSAFAGDRLLVTAAKSGDTEITLTAWGAAEPVRLRVRAR